MVRLISNQSFLRIYLKRLLLTSLLLGACVWLLSKPAQAASYTVINTNDSGAGSLRQAIIDANAGIGADTISFSIGSGRQQIIPTSAMPAIVNPVVIDGTTQPGFSGAPLIELSGNGAGSGAIGLRITGNGAGSTVKGLIINRFDGNGIFLDSGNNTIKGNYIGTTADGMSGAGNKGDGIGIFSGVNIVSSSNNLIGGTSASDRNIISGNGANGVVINAQNGGITNQNTISGNFIGTTAAGTWILPNGGDGVLINDAGSGSATGNVVGGTTSTSPAGTCTGSCNLISGNRANGVGLWHTGVQNNTVLGNFIGLNVNGNGSLANGDIGVEAQDAPNNTIGSISSNGRNIISGNNGAGVFVSGGGSTGVSIFGNYIGTNPTGTAAVPNQKMGVGIGFTTAVTPAHHINIGGSDGTTPGGACTGACNLISGNSQNGILMVGPGGNQVLGNYIGTDATGTANIRNTLDGIGIAESPNNSIGNGTASGRNVISANGDNGVIITGGSGNRIEANFIGQGSNGISLGNAGAGVMLAGGVDTAILANGIAYNVKLGIDLGYNNVSLNDANDGDGGANRTQNFPSVFAASSKGGTTKIGGNFNSTPNTSFRLDLFASNNCNAGVPNNFGEGQDYIGSTTIGTDAFGNTAWGFTPVTAVNGGRYITATATKLIGATPAETSEFSQCILVNVTKPALSNGATWFLKNDLTPGPADKTFGYGFPSYLIMCAWDPNQPGVKLPVVFSGGQWFMRASYTTGTADLSFSYGASNARPVCADWDGDGTETVGVVTPDSTWSLRNVNSPGVPQIGPFQYGPFNSTPVAGDWNGDGSDGIGTVDAGNNWSLRNATGSGPANMAFHYGVGQPIVGDWNGDGADTVGVVSNGGHWALKNEFSDGPSQIDFDFGFPGAKPLTW